MSSVVASLDVGTTILRCHIYDRNGKIISSARDVVEHLQPQPSYDEIDAEQIFQKVVCVINEAITKAGITAKNVKCLGMSCQRSSFVTWQKSTGKPFHNVITWKDLRADSIIQSLNNLPTFKALKVASSLAYFFTRQKRFLAASQLQIMNNHITARLHWVKTHITALQQAIEKDDAAFGTLDSWLLYRLSSDKIHVTDVSQAACTGFYDPFIMDWSSYFQYIFSIPKTMLPTVLDTSTHFCYTEPSLFGFSIPITCSVADQSAAMFGDGCVEKGDVKITLGTGTFVKVNSGDQPVCVPGLYPIIGWRINGRVGYIAEGAANDTGTVIQWAVQMGIIQDPEESASIAESVQSNGGVYFIPAFGGIQAPIYNDQAAAGFIGITQTTTKAHLMRAILESIAFRVDQLFELVKNNVSANLTEIRVDGGVSQNRFVMQLIADLTNATIIVPKSPERSALGAAIFAGLAVDFWKSESFKEEQIIYKPNNRSKHENDVRQWRRALSRFLSWYENP